MGRIFGSSCHTASWIVAMVVGIIFFSLGMTLGIIGSVKYPIEEKWQKYGLNTTCNVEDWWLEESICGSKYRYICYEAAWQVWFLTEPDPSTGAVSNVTTIMYDGNWGSSSYALNRGYTHDIGYQGLCYYMSNNFANARWQSPNPGPYLGLLIAGWVMFGLSFVCGGMVYLCIKASAHDY